MQLAGVSSSGGVLSASCCKYSRYRFSSVRRFERGGQGRWLRSLECVQAMAIGPDYVGRMLDGKVGERPPFMLDHLI